MAILVSAGSLVPWLDYSPLAGVVNPGEMVEVEVSFDATGLVFGDYYADLTFNSNDADMAQQVIPVILTVTDDATPVEVAPLAFRFEGAAPNPFNPATTMRFNLPVAGHAELKLFDVQGRVVRTLIDGHRAAGQNEVRWDGRDQSGRQVASGTYYARLVAADQSSVKSLVLVK
jgi:hypothetical protein